MVLLGGKKMGIGNSSDSIVKRGEGEGENCVGKGSKWRLGDYLCLNVISRSIERGGFWKKWGFGFDRGWEFDVG